MDINKKLIMLSLAFVVTIFFFSSVSFAVDDQSSTIIIKSQKIISNSNSNTTAIAENNIKQSSGVKAGTVSLNEALDSNLSWTTGGDASWHGYNDGTSDYAVSGTIGNYGETWIQTIVNGPGTLKFKWKVSSESDFDYLNLYIDGQSFYEISGDKDWQQRTLNLNSGSHTIRFSYEKDQSNFEGSDQGFVDEIEWTQGTIISLNEALDSNLTWTTGGNANWYGYSIGTSDYAVSGSIGNSQESWIQTTVNGPGIFKFKANVSSESGYDNLNLYLDGKYIYANSEDVDWQQRTLNLGPGSHTIRFTYKKDITNSAGSDQGYIDQVEWIPGNNPNLNTKTYAILVGIANFQTINDLDYPDDDVCDMYDLATTIWRMPASHIFTLVNFDATKNNIHNLISTVAAMMGPQDNLVFYFSGHGSTGTDISPIDETDGKDEYLVPYDATSTQSTMIRDDEIADWLSVVPTSNILAIFDTCYSGGMTKSIITSEENIKSISEASGNITNGFARDINNYMVLMASDYNETSLEDSDLSNGVFTYYFVEAFHKNTDPLVDLDNDQTISIEEAFNYARTNVLSSTGRHAQIYDPNLNEELEIPEKTPPTVTEFDPVNGTVNVVPGKIINVIFSEPIKIGSAIFELQNLTTGALVSINYSINGNVLTITPTSALTEAKYKLILNSGCINDLAGNPLAYNFTTFSAGVSPTVYAIDPLVNAINVSPNKIINITFNEAIQAGSNFWIELRDGSGNLIPITKEINGNILTISHNEPLINGLFTLILYGASITDLAENPLQYYSSNFTVDSIPPTATVNPSGNLYKYVQNVNLAMNEDGIIYFTTDGSAPSVYSAQYNGPISITNSTLLRFMAVDLAGNQSPFYEENYIIDMVAPTASASPLAGYYNVTKIVSLTMNENGSIYFTTDGNIPSIYSTKYIGPITIASNTLLNYMAVDLAGNLSQTYTQQYTIDKIAPKVLSTTPKNLATNISRTGTIAIKFSENIYSGTNYSKITVKNLSTGKTTNITKTISGSTLSIKNSSKRSSYTWYQVTIPAGAIKDKAGNILAKAYTFKFKTKG